eukprot:Em0019g93a
MTSRSSHHVSVTWREEYKNPVYPQLEIPQAISDTRCESAAPAEENNFPPSYLCGQALITAYPSHGDTLEDRLHQEIKHHVERFKVTVQQLLSEQLGLAQGYPTDDCHVVPSDDPPDTAYGLENDMYEPPRHYLCNKSEACSSFNPSQEDGLYIDDMSRVDAIESDMTNIVAIERQMDRCLIQLQTLASIVSLALRRTEYL